MPQFLSKHKKIIAPRGNMEEKSGDPRSPKHSPVLLLSSQVFLDGDSAQHPHLSNDRLLLLMFLICLGFKL